jgi:hypothetical protein
MIIIGYNILNMLFLVNMLFLRLLCQILQMDLFMLWLSTIYLESACAPWFGGTTRTTGPRRKMDQMKIDTTFRLIELGGRDKDGPMASTPELAKEALAIFDRRRRLGMEQIDWEEDGSGKLCPKRTVLIDAEAEPGQWTLGAPMPPEDPTH